MSAWIIVADSYRARIFSAAEPTGPITEINTLVHPECRLKEQQLTEGGAGSSFDGGGQGRHRFEPRTRAGDHEVTVFAKQICDCIEAGRKEGRFDGLYIIAVPTMLGEVRKQLDASTRKKIIGVIDKEYAGESAARIRSILPPRLWSVADYSH